MKRITLLGSILMVLLPLLASCHSSVRTDTSSQLDEPALDGEELRLERSCRLDSTTLRTVLHPDTMAGADGLDTLTAGAWLLVDDASGLVISQRNAGQRMYPASLTKMMTCLLALEHGRLTDTIDITKEVRTTRDCRVSVGERYLAGNLIRQMMLVSDNVSAIALACHLSGDTVAFSQRMNDKAAYLGMCGTHFDNPNGLPNDSNYSTAHDLLLLARYAMRDSLFAAVVATDSMDVPLADGRHMPCKNTNQLLRTYEGCIGVKTGYTRKAGSCLASAATRDGTTLFLILLKSKNHTTRFAESAALLDYGFRVMKHYRRQLISRGLRPLKSLVKGGIPAATHQHPR